MTDHKLPRTFLQDAWCRIRLDTIRTAVTETIDQLQQLEPPEDRPLDVARASAREAALLTCSKELRQESGLEAAEPSAPGRTQQSDASWLLRYDQALIDYRQAALDSLRKSLG